MPLYLTGWPAGARVPVLLGRPQSAQQLKTEYRQMDGRAIKKLELIEGETFGLPSIAVGLTYELPPPCNLVASMEFEDRREFPVRITFAGDSVLLNRHENCTALNVDLRASDVAKVESFVVRGEILSNGFGDEIYTGLTAVKDARPTGED